MSVRVRFAPSPTGPLHIGGVRTALYNYLFAKKNNGKFLLRIEDTDQTRYVPGAENYIIESLKWLGLNYEEGVDIGGKFAPYRQSERKEIYNKYVQILLDNGKAYYAFDTPEELENLRVKLQEEKSSVQHYCPTTRGIMKNSFTLKKEEVDELLKNGTPYVVRFNMPENQMVVMQDIIRGEIKINSSTLDDKVLYKSDGLPTYHLANIVDDHLMEITHVIRGEEWLPSLPLHYLLYDAFGWTPPQFSHLPLILKPNGKGKLSKRDGDQMGFPVFPIEWNDPETQEKSTGYREFGYLPQAVVNMLALLGWNPGTETEIFSIDELAQAFDLEKVHKSGAKFDPEKTKWFNQQHLKLLDTEILVNDFVKILSTKNIEPNYDFAKKIVELVRERAVFTSDLWDLTSYFFVAPTDFDEKAIKKHWKEDTKELVQKTLDFFKTQNNFSAKILEENTIKWLENNQISLGKVLNPIRLLIVGTTTGPHLFDIISNIGKIEFIKRIEFGLSKF